MWVRKDDGLDQGGSSRRWEIWLNSKYVLRVEPTGFVAVLAVGWWAMMLYR